MQMGTKRQPILVMGATGRQGGAVAQRLLKKGWTVRAFVRDTGKPGAQHLREQGAQLAQGNFDDRDALLAAMKGIYGIFSVQDPSEAGVEGEVLHGGNIAECAHTAGVSHFIYSSAASAHRETGIPHFDSKARIEERIKLLELPYTILRPVFFMENWQTIAGQSLRERKIALPLDPDKPLQQIAAADIAFFAANALEHPDDWIAHELDIAGDELTMSEVAEAFSRILGRRIEYTQIPMSQFRRSAGNDLALMYEWFNEAGYRANIGYLRRQHPELQTLAQFLRSQEWLKPLIASGSAPGARKAQGR